MINFSPYATNVLDCLDIPLKTSSGDTIEITKPMISFNVKRNGKLVLETADNLEVCYFLNQLEVDYDLENRTKSRSSS